MSILPKYHKVSIYQILELITIMNFMQQLLKNLKQQSSIEVLLLKSKVVSGTKICLNKNNEK